MMQNMTQIYHPDGVYLFTKNPVITKLASAFRFADGPLWHPEGYLMLSDINLDRIFQIYLNGIVHVPLYNSGGRCILYKKLSDMIASNGLEVNEEENLIFCQHGNHGISKMVKAKNILRLCSSLDGNLFNSANDIVVKSDGAIFFTDPPYGIKTQALNPSVFQSHNGLYRFFNNQLSLIVTDLKYPHGLCFSEDERHLLVSSNHPDEKKIYKYELSADGEIIHKEIFAYINADGIKMDKHNNLYAATNDGVVILSPDGEKLAHIELNDMPTNITFGGEDESLLFITTPEAVFYLAVDDCVHKENKSNLIESNKKDWDEKEKVNSYKKLTFRKNAGFIKVFISSFW